jgi:hypothetical protein
VRRSLFGLLCQEICRGTTEFSRGEHALTSDYEGLKKDFGDLRSSLTIVVKEKAGLEKTEREKAQWFLNSLRNKLAEL